MPDADTLMQKTIPASDIVKYMDGTYTQIGGFVTRAEHMGHLKTYEEIYKSLRLDYPGSLYNPASDETLGILRYVTDEVEKFSIPYGAEMGGTVTGEFPFTGNGFTKAVNGEIIPEYICNVRMDIPDNTELIELGLDGTEKVIAIYSKIDKMFIPVE